MLHFCGLEYASGSNNLWVINVFFFLQSCKHLLKWLILSMSSLIDFTESVHMTEDEKAYKCLQDLTRIL